jgi:hypothetical protein
MFRVYGGQPVGMGNAGAIAGGIPLKDLFPNAPSDVGTPVQTPGVVRPGTKQKLKDIFPPGRGVPNMPPDHPLYNFVRRGFTGDLVQTSPYLENNSFGVAGNPFGPGFVIPGKGPVKQPVLPGEDRGAVEGVYGTPGPKPMPGSAPLGLPMAMGSSNLPNAIGNMAGVANSQFYRGPQLGQAGLYFGGVM